LQFDIKKQKDIADALWKNDLPKVNAQLKSAKVNELTILARADFDKMDSGGADTAKPQKPFFHIF
jgi:hypothetical protein